MELGVPEVSVFATPVTPLRKMRQRLGSEGLAAAPCVGLGKDFLAVEIAENFTKLNARSNSTSTPYLLRSKDVVSPALHSSEDSGFVSSMPQFSLGSSARCLEGHSVSDSHISSQGAVGTSIDSCYESLTGGFSSPSHHSLDSGKEIESGHGKEFMDSPLQISTADVLTQDCTIKTDISEFSLHADQHKSLSPIELHGSMRLKTTFPESSMFDFSLGQYSNLETDISLREHSSGACADIDATIHTEFSPSGVTLDQFSSISDSLHQSTGTSSVSPSLSNNDSSECVVPAQDNAAFQAFLEQTHSESIGRRMGREYVDFLPELQKETGYQSICNRLILSYLSVDDLLSVHKVSSQWKSICKRCPEAERRRHQYRRHLDQEKRRYGKENISKKLLRCSRGLTGASEPLSALQSVGSSSVSTQPDPAPSPKTPDTAGKMEIDSSRHCQFVQAAANIKSCESLRKCPKCQSPSRVSEAEERAECSFSSCQFDFCIKCRCDFHGAKACITTAAKKTKTEKVGSKKSKKNLRRL